MSCFLKEVNEISHDWDELMMPLFVCDAEGGNTSIKYHLVDSYG